MAFDRRSPRAEWLPFTAGVSVSYEADPPVWILNARRGRHWQDIAGGPMPTIATGFALARHLRQLDPARWDGFINRQLRDILADAWG